MGEEGPICHLVWDFVYYLVTKSCQTLCSSMDYSLQAPVHGTFHARILEWVAISSLRASSLTLGLNPHLLHWQMDSLPLSYLGSPLPELLKNLLSVLHFVLTRRLGQTDLGPDFLFKFLQIVT